MPSICPVTPACASTSSGSHRSTACPSRNSTVLSSPMEMAYRDPLTGITPDASAPNASASACR